jgi:hypothetical protein
MHRSGFWSIRCIQPIIPAPRGFQMTARIRVKADRIIRQYEQFKADSVRAFELQTEHNNLVKDLIDKSRERNRLKYPEIWLFLSDSLYFYRSDAIDSSNGIYKLYELAKKSDDKYVEIDEDMSRFVGLNVSDIEKSLNSSMKDIKSEITNVYAEIEQLNNPEKQNAIQEVSDALDKLTKPRGPAPWPEPTTMDMSGFYIPCILAVLIFILLGVIFGAHQ